MISKRRFPKLFAVVEVLLETYIKDGKLRRAVARELILPPGHDWRRIESWCPQGSEAQCTLAVEPELYPGGVPARTRKALSDLFEYAVQLSAKLEK